MNFLLRSTHHVAPELRSVPELEIPKEGKPTHKKAITLEGLIADDPFPMSPLSEDGDKDSHGFGDVSGASGGLASKNHVPTGNHSDVVEDEGWITIPYRELPDDWTDASDILQLRSLDRSFIFPGEQLHILVCLSTSKQDTEIITPFKVAAVMSKNGSSGKKRLEASENKSSSISEQEQINGTCEETSGQITEENGETKSTSDMGHDREDISETESLLRMEGHRYGETKSTSDMDHELEDISETESLLRMEGHRHHTETLLERFRNSNFFVRIAESDEPLWSKRKVAEPSSTISEVAEGKIHSNDGGSRKMSRNSFVNAVIDSGRFDGNTFGGVARNTVRCYSLRNGDIVVLLQVNAAISDIKDPVLEVLQFEKYGAANSASENLNGLLLPNHEDPCRGLLNWLVPLDRTLPPPLSLTPSLNSSSGLTSMAQRSTSASSTSQIFSLGHFRSYSMPSLPPTAVSPSPAVPPSNSKPAFDLEDFDRISHEKVMGQDTKNDGLLSFRGVSLEPERFSVHCGLEGIYLPGRRWRRKLETIQPIEIHSFASECISEDILCVQVKNVSPAHLPDIVIFLDSIAIVYEETSKGGPPLSLPIASIEAGNGHSLPNLVLRRGEEHSFILKPVTPMGRDLKGHGDTSSLQPPPKTALTASNLHPASRGNDGRRVPPSADQYSVLVSCRCNYTESKLFFKQQTGWRPRIARDLMISVVPEMSEQNVGRSGRVPQLPIQVLTLQASNLTSEDLTLTVLAPVSSSSLSVVPLNSTSTTPKSSFIGFPEFLGRAGGVQRISSMPVPTESHKESKSGGKRSVSLAQRTGATSDVMSTSDLGCTHLWLQSTVPLGCVPGHSSATVKLELLPLTDGIITLDTLQLAVKEKGMTYIPEQPLKIYATSSMTTAIA